jgi:hypothetical protein
MPFKWALFNSPGGTTMRRLATTVPSCAMRTIVLPLYCRRRNRSLRRADLRDSRRARDIYRDDQGIDAGDRLRPGHPPWRCSDENPQSDAERQDQYPHAFEAQSQDAPPYGPNHAHSGGENLTFDTRFRRRLSTPTAAVRFNR